MPREGLPARERGPGRLTDAAAVVLVHGGQDREDDVAYELWGSGVVVQDRLLREVPSRAGGLEAAQGVPGGADASAGHPGEGREDREVPRAHVREEAVPARAVLRASRGRVLVLDVRPETPGVLAHGAALVLQDGRFIAAGDADVGAEGHRNPLATARASGRGILARRAAPSQPLSLCPHWYRREGRVPSPRGTQGFERRGVPPTFGGMCPSNRIGTSPHRYQEPRWATAGPIYRRAPSTFSRTNGTRASPWMRQQVSTSDISGGGA